MSAATRAQESSEAVAHITAAQDKWVASTQGFVMAAVLAQGKGTAAAQQEQRLGTYCNFKNGTFQRGSKIYLSLAVNYNLYVF